MKVYSYDANGNQLQTLVNNNFAGIYAYDLFNRQVSFSSNNIGFTYYTYRPDGLRHSAGTTKHFWSEANIVLEKTGNTITEYHRGLTLIYYKQGSTVRYYLFNGHGDVVKLTNDTGVVVKTYVYDAFGEEQDIIDTDTNHFRYCGEYYDKETKTLYLRARYYSSATGRFTQEDPIKDGANWYSYCANNPVNLIDPSGLAWWHWAVAVGVVALCAALTVITAGGFAAAAGAVMAVAGGTVTASGVATTIAAAAFVGSATSLAYSVADAGAKCDTWDEFADYGETAMINTEIGCGVGMLYGAGLEAANSIDQKIASNQQSKAQTQTKSSQASKTSSKNSCPNPNGKKGGIAHQNTIEIKKQNLSNEGYKNIHGETKISTPGGKKPYRFVDISAELNGETHYFQVGKSNITGEANTYAGAVARERTAMDDLIHYAKIDARNVHFISYNK